MRCTKMSRRIKIKLVVLVTTLLFLLSSISYSLAVDKYPKAVVDVHEDSHLIVRKGPGPGYDTTYVHLASKSVVSILDMYDGWALVQFPKLVGVREPIGWVCMDYLKD